MKLKKLIYGVSLCAAVAVLSACSDISEDERFIYVEPATVAKRVLIEDFTGQNCTNCPAANDVISQLQAEYGHDNVIAVAIHSGPFGRNTPLRTDEGDSYYNNWGVSVQPTGMIDRHGLLPDYNSWGTVVYNCIQQEATILLDATCSYDGESRVANITVNADGIDNIAGKLQVWLTEDNIVSGQQLEGRENYDYNYVHNHVYRANVSNELMGDAITVATGERVTRTFSYTLNEEWVPENMSVVAFIYNDTDGVLQAVTTKIVAAEEGTTEEAE